jgi:hypothetical protein
MHIGKLFVGKATASMPRNFDILVVFTTLGGMEQIETRWSWLANKLYILQCFVSKCLSSVVLFCQSVNYWKKSFAG